MRSGRRTRAGGTARSSTLARRPQTWTYLRVLPAAAALAATSCTSIPDAKPPSICRAEGVEVSVGFASSGRHTCRMEGEGRVVVTVSPEGEPINPSPWYAFRLDIDRSMDLQVVLDYGSHDHRYAPKVSRDGKTWESLPPLAVSVSADGRQARLQLTLEPGALWVAAQPLATPAEAQDWAERRLFPAGFRAVEYGRSRQGHPLMGYVGGEGKDLIVAVTRQHPPEVTGSAAFRAFAERLAADTPEARAFRARTRLLLVPMANPDGVLAGNWRWNEGGVDLNRDWGAFSQPETRALRDLILSETKGRRPGLLLDFHSTRRSVVYAPALDPPVAGIEQLADLQQAIDRSLGAPVPWTFSHNASEFNLKRWAFEVLHAPGLTVEVADDADAATIEIIGRALADELVRTRSP